MEGIEGKRSIAGFYSSQYGTTYIKQMTLIIVFEY